MAGDARSGGRAPEVEAQFGKRLWGPPADLERRGERRRTQLRIRAVGLFGMAVTLAMVAALVAGPNAYDIATGLMAAAVLVAVAASWVLYEASRHGGLMLGVFERGVLLPSSFESVPGIATMGGPVFVHRGSIDRVEDMRSGDERAVVVWSTAGRSGLLSAREAGAARTMLDEFLAAALGLASGPGHAAEEE